MNEKFEEIRIVDLDTEKTRPSERGSAMRYMYLRLSHMPPHRWSDIFDEERRFPRHSMWRRAYVQGQYIVVDCVPEELETYHLRDLKQDVANTNSKYQEYAARVAAQQRREMEEQDRERAGLDSLKKKLRFD